MTSPFDEELAGLAEEREPYDEAVATLLELADAIQSQVFAGVKNAEVNVTPGHTVNMGQQYKVQVRIVDDRNQPHAAYNDTLFRAYIPLEGYPAVIDLFGEEKRKCKNKKELLEALKVVLRDKAFQLRLRSLRTLAVHQVTGG